MVLFPRLKIIGESLSNSIQKKAIYPRSDDIEKNERNSHSHFQNTIFSPKNSKLAALRKQLTSIQYFKLICAD